MLTFKVSPAEAMGYSDHSTKINVYPLVLLENVCSFAAKLMSTTSGAEVLNDDDTALSTKLSGRSPSPLRTRPS